MLSNALGWFPRLALTLGLDPKAAPEDLVRAWQKRVSTGIAPIPATEVKDGPIFENVKRGADVDDGGPAVGVGGPAQGFRGADAAHRESCLRGGVAVRPAR